MPRPCADVTVNDRIKREMYEGLSFVFNTYPLGPVSIGGHIGRKQVQLLSSGAKVRKYMAFVDVVFTREATVIETGGGTVEVEDPTNWEEIEQKVREGRFTQFLISQREYEDDDMEWEIERLEELTDETA